MYDFGLLGEIVPEAAKKDVEKTDKAEEDHFGAKDYRKEMNLKPDHESRPLWVVSLLQRHKFVVILNIQRIEVI